MTRPYTIRDLERETGVPRTTIHFYLRQGLLPRAQKTAASRSLYTEEHVALLETIGALKEKGHTLAEIESALQARLDDLNETSVDLAAREWQRVHDRILAVAAREFVAEGYKNTHVTGIMRKAGVTATSFYNHFPSKRRLLTECVTLAMDWSGAYADEQRVGAADSAESLLWNVFGHLRAFELGSAALAVIRLEGDDEEDPAGSVSGAMAGALVAEVERIRQLLDAGGESAGREATKPSSAVPTELVALALFASYQPLALCPIYDTYGPEALLEAHLWLFLAAQAARSGEIDIDSRMARYRPLIARLAAAEPPLPPALETGEAEPGGQAGGLM